MSSISVSELLNINDAIIIDIRSYNNYLHNHIPGAISIEESKLAFNPEKYLNFKDTYYLYCYSGVRSRLLVNKLNKLGYHTVTVFGGFYHYLLNK